MLRPLYSSGLGLVLFCLPACGLAEEIPLPVDDQALGLMYSGREKLRYQVSWSGGIPVGDLYMEITPAEEGGGFKIMARVIDEGLLRAIYPVDDTFTTYVQPPLMLPYRYEVLQKEGHGKETRRLTLYDQENLGVRYQKNAQPEKAYAIDGMVYNEFTGFLMTRVLALADEQPPLIPTFVDEERHLVAVVMNGKVELDTMFGPVPTMELQPRMDFKGLYDKDGDTVIWVTDDACRVPVQIDSRLMIGSLTATLVAYENDACPRYHQVQLADNSTP
jgi:hypothetical protein